MKKILFLCSRNKLRSPTAEQVFSARTDVEVASAGTNHDADNPLTEDLVDWADLIVAMERTHRAKVQQRFGRNLNGKKIVCLEILDNYDFMDPVLVRLLEVRMARFLPG